MTTPKLRTTLRGLSLAALLLSAACTDRVPTAGSLPAGREVRTQIACTVSVADRAVRCGDPAPAGGGAQSVIVGGQGTYVRLESANAGYDSTASEFSVDVTVQNLLGQPMGTPDGTTATGVKVFFDQAPTATDGAGEITIANADGEASFTAAAQPYFSYPEVLAPRGRSAPRTWRFATPASVHRFRFVVYVSTELPAELGALRWEQEEGLATLPVTHVRALWGTSARDVFAVGLSGRILHFDGARWTSMPTGAGAALLGVWGSARDNVYAVGDSGTVLRYDGNRWSRLLGPHISRSLRTAWGRGDTLWIAGYERDGHGVDKGLILRSTDRGQSWTETFLPVPSGGQRYLWGLTGTADGALVATGQQYTNASVVDAGVVLRSTDGGVTWTEQVFSGGGVGRDRRLYRVWAQGSHVFAVGETRNAALRFEALVMRSADGGVTWSETIHPAVTALYGVWGAAPDDVTAVGNGGAILRFDGESWTPVQPAGATAHLHGVWGSAAAGMFAAGNDQSLARRTGGPWVLAPPAGIRTRDYVAAWGPARDDLYVVAQSYDDATNRWGTALLRRTRGAWSTVRAREQDLELRSIWGSGPNNVLVAGFRYTTAGYQGVILRYDGTGWTETVSASGPDRRFHAVHGDGAGNAWVVGNHQDATTFALDALVLRSGDGGATWTETRIPVPAHTPQLFDVWASGPADVHAVGMAFRNAEGKAYGLRMRFDGAQWHQAMEPVESELSVVWGTGDGTVYAGGLDGGSFGAATGLLLTSTNGGVDWSRTSFPATLGNRRSVSAIWSASPDVVYAAGAGGPVMQLEGGQWSPVGPSTVPIGALWGFSSGDVWALGSAGSVFHGTR